MNKLLSVLIFLSLTSGCLDNSPREINDVIFTIENEEIVRGEVIIFTTNRSDYPSGSSFLWTFGDGSGTGGTTAEHIYSTEGVFEVSLTVVASDGSTGQYIEEIEVLYPNSPPTALSHIVNEAGFVQLGRVNTQFFFYGNDSFDPEGSSLNYSWNFGDDSTGSGMYTNHTYTAAGNYTVNLIVTDERNISSSINSWTNVKNYEYNISFQEMESLPVFLHSEDDGRLLEGETNRTIWAGYNNLTSVRIILEWDDDIQTVDDLTGLDEDVKDQIENIIGTFFPDTFELSINTSEISSVGDFSEQDNDEYIEANFTHITELPDNPGIYQFETNNGAWSWLANNFAANETGHSNWTIDVSCIDASPDGIPLLMDDPDNGNDYTLYVVFVYYIAILTEVSIV